MSVVQNTLIGRARQKIGGSVFSSWKGINVLKSKPLTVANPRTDAQQVQRNALKILTAFYRQVSGTIQIGFKQQAIQKSEFNAFTSYNLKNAINKAGAPVAAIIPQDLLVSQGTIAATALLSGSSTTSTQTVAVTWPTAADLPGQSSNDKAFLVAYNSTLGTVFSGASIGLRSDGSGDLVLPTGSFVVGNTVVLYFFFQSATGVKTSDSLHRNTTAVS